MDDITLPSALSLRTGNSSKAESRKRYGPAGDARSRLAQARLALSRQASFDVGGCSADTADTSPPNSLVRFRSVLLCLLKLWNAKLFLNPKIGFEAHHFFYFVLPLLIW